MLGAPRPTRTGNTLLRTRHTIVEHSQLPDRSAQAQSLAGALARLAEVGLIPQVAQSLGNTLGQTAQLFVHAVVGEIPAFSASGNPETLPELNRHCAEHIEELQRLLSGAAPGDFEFVKTHAHRRAEQHFPIEATLHAYRCGHRIVAHWIRDATVAIHPDHLERAVSAVADFAIEYTNAISTIAAAEYVARTRALAATESDSRAELLDTLLKGFDESDGRIARLLKSAGYLEQRQAYCVVLGQSTDPLEMENPARAQRITEAVTEAFSCMPVRVLCGVRNSVAITIVSSTRRASGWTPPQSSLADRVRERLLTLGPAVLIGVSRDQPSTAFIPRAWHEAEAALSFARVTERVVLFAELPLRRLLLHRSGAYVQSALPAWVPSFFEADEKSRGALLQTLRAYADADMNVQKAAAALLVHPNTVYSRMGRIRELTGLDSQRYHDLTELLLVIECRGA
jgi:PucR C-terminal helix-turn-helix domain/GGDEF-like domain